MDGRYPRLRIADWQVAARPHGTASTNGPAGRTGRRTSTRSPGGIFGARRAVRRAYLAPEFRPPRLPRRCSTCSASARQLPDPHRPAAGIAAVVQLAAKLTTERRARPVFGRRLGQPPHGRSGPRRHPGLGRRPHRVGPAIPPRPRRDRGRADRARRQAEPGPADRQAKATRSRAGPCERVLGKGSTSRALLVKKGEARCRPGSSRSR